MSTSGELPDYYEILGVSKSATPSEIRKQYKIQALKTHPDRVPADSPERPARTRRFQQVNDAFYVLSDSGRRTLYDQKHAQQSRPKARNWQEAQFGDIFEEMMREEGFQGQDTADAAAAAGGATVGTGRLYSLLGGASGAVMGFIIGNFPGALAGAIAGNRLGAVRDVRGKAVYEVFLELPQGDKAKLLTDLLTKVMAHAVSV